MQEWLNWHAWKACEPLKGSAGSNPALSAPKVQLQNLQAGYSGFLFAKISEPNRHMDHIVIFFLCENLFDLW